jgi:hypothetical protein
VQSAYYQLKPGKVFFKRFSKAIGKDAQGEYFGNCNSLQTLKYLLLYCKHYAQERRVLAKALHRPWLTLSLLFNTTKERAALVGFLKETKIAIARWLVPAGAL